MKAVVVRKYGSPEVLELQEVPKPRPGDAEILIKVQAAALNAADWHMMRADPFAVRLMAGLFKPKFKIPGADVAGRVEAVGKNVKSFKVGDEVFGDLARYAWGSFAEYVCAPENLLAIKPVNLSFEEAAAVPMAAVTALQALRDKGGIRAGQSVLINGASGGVGSFAVQIAKAFGAEVTAVCSARNVDRARALGADHVIDYGAEDFTKSGRRYDLILATNGYHPLSAYRRALSPEGAYVTTGGAGKQMVAALFLGPWLSLLGQQKIGNAMAKPNAKDLGVVKELLEGGKVKPAIDRRYPLDRLPEAMRYLEEGHAQGKIVITVS
jgi:NADPH:quinone reductase-like Zn-dependent oxidoreductase